MWHKQMQYLWRITGHKSQVETPQDEEAPNSTPPELLYLMLCCNEGLHGIKLHQLKLQQNQTDEALFLELGRIYQSSRKWLSFLSFRAVTDIRFAQIEWFVNQLANIRMYDDLPPKAKTGEAEFYQYIPRPQEVKPPLAKHYLMHAFLSPEEVGKRSMCFNRFPKRLSMLQVLDETGMIISWGIQLQEGLNPRKIWVCVYLLCVFGGTLAFLLFWLVGHNITKSCAIASLMASITTLTIGFAQAMAGPSV